MKNNIEKIKRDIKDYCDFNIFLTKKILVTFLKVKILTILSLINLIKQLME